MHGMLWLSVVVHAQQEGVQHHLLTPTQRKRVCYCTLLRCLHTLHVYVNAVCMHTNSMGCSYACIPTCCGSSSNVLLLCLLVCLRTAVHAVHVRVHAQQEGVQHHLLTPTQRKSVTAHCCAVSIHSTCTSTPCACTGCTAAGCCCSMDCAMLNSYSCSTLIATWLAGLRSAADPAAVAVAGTGGHGVQL